MSTYKIEKLKGAENYQVWAFKVIRLLVDKLGSYNILSDDPQSDDPKSEQGKRFILWTSNEIAITVMTMAMTNQILHHVMDSNFAEKYGHTRKINITGKMYSRRQNCPNVSSI